MVATKTSTIEIQVHGQTGTGKTQVARIIRNALVARFGRGAMVTSYDLALEEEQDAPPPSTEHTVFVIVEVNHPRPKASP